MAKAVASGMPKLKIEEAAARKQARIDSGAGQLHINCLVHLLTRVICVYTHIITTPHTITTHTSQHRGDCGSKQVQIGKGRTHRSAAC